MSKIDKLLMAILAVLVICIGFNTSFLLTGCEKSKEDESTTAPSKVAQSKSIPEFVPYDTPPKGKHITQPEYPEEAKNAGIEGTVYLRIAIDTNGEVLDVEVLKGVHQLLDSAATAAARTWSYEPAMSKGKPVSVWIGQPVTFRLTEKEEVIENKLKKE